MMKPIEIDNDDDNEEVVPLTSAPRNNKTLPRPPPPPASSSSCISYRCSLCALCSCVILASTLLAVSYMGSGESGFFGQSSGVAEIRGSEESSTIQSKSGDPGGGPPLISSLVPSELVGVTYFQKDVINDANVVPTYWNCSRVPGDCRRDTWGPCYPTSTRVRWQKEVDRQQASSDKKDPAYHAPQIYHSGDTDVGGYCRPGFVILGAGKCGTSSLYHYLCDHPRVMPAKEKQIHYFKYHTKRPMKWYMSHFPTATSFMASGTLMTGEASPGYLPYPDVAALMAQRMPGSRLIVLGRNPIERAYSSFMYSYMGPMLQQLKRGRVKHVPTNLTDDEYKAKYLFTFEETMRAELKVLRECLAPNGSAIVKAEQAYRQAAWGNEVFDRRERLGLPPLADMDRFCYGERVNKTVLRPQWAELVAQYPKKVILDVNTHLLQSHLGRSIYVLPMEWWYAHFDASDIFFLCTEAMEDLSGASMEPLRQWLGLPVFNFSHTLKQGAYNVGGHRGYDKEISWDEITRNNTSGGFSPTQVIPLSPAFRAELQDFLEPYNERLFQLAGKRCRW